MAIKCFGNFSIFDDFTIFSIFKDFWNISTLLAISTISHFKSLLIQEMSNGP